MTTYRYPNEQLILVITVFLILGILFFAAGVTICVVPLILLVFLFIAYRLNTTNQRALMEQGLQITAQQTPELYNLTQKCMRKLKPGQVDFVLIRNRQLNAYTFGLSEPNTVVLFDSLLKYMDEDELSFIVGHELGHVALGHTWINTLLGGMAGVPMGLDAVIIFTLAFRWWNRACEYSADRAGLLACGDLRKATSALVKLVFKEADTPAEIQYALNVIEKEDDSWENVLAETISTHPMIVKRIDEMKKYAASSEYQRLKNYLAQIN